MTIIHVWKLALTYRKLLRSADSGSPGWGLTRHRNENSVVCNVKPRTNMCARTSEKWRGKKSVYSSPKRSHLFLTFLSNDEREHLGVCYHEFKGLSGSVLKDAYFYIEQLMAEDVFVALSSVHWSPVRILDHDKGSTWLKYIRTTVYRHPRNKLRIKELKSGKCGNWLWQK
jgi:hypothetical protein